MYLRNREKLLREGFRPTDEFYKLLQDIRMREWKYARDFGDESQHLKIDKKARDEWEHQSREPGCFIATSAYEGNQNHPTVVKLRQYRDDILSNSSAGQKFIEFYYGGFGQNAAKVLDAVTSLKPFVRNSLDLLVEKIVNPALERRQTFSSQSKSYAA